jgi:cation transport protein ChaC
MVDPAPDPFAHHPELRDRIKDPSTSFFRSFNARTVFERSPELRWVLDLLLSDQAREVSRRAILAQHGTGDLWVFAYGSLMWDPALRFTDVRRAVVPDYARRFILKDVWGGRGTRESPGVMAALDSGDGCEGLVFRIARQDIETETEILWRREMVGPAYQPSFVSGLVDGEPVQVLTFVADYAADSIAPDLSRAEQIAYCATGAGVLGTSHEYLSNIVAQFAALGVVDAHCTDLLREVEAFKRAHPATDPVVSG